MNLLLPCLHNLCNVQPKLTLFVYNKGFHALGEDESMCGEETGGLQTLLVGYLSVEILGQQEEKNTPALHAAEAKKAEIAPRIVVSLALLVLQQRPLPTG